MLSLSLSLSLLTRVRKVPSLFHAYILARTRGAFLPHSGRGFSFAALALLLLCAPIFAVSTGYAAERGGLTGTMPRSQIAASASPTNPYAQNSLQWSLFNATASFLGLPGLVSPVDGLADEGMGFHADGTTRRLGEGDGAAGGFSGQRAASYVRSGQMAQQPWLYDSLMGGTRDANGRFWDMGNEYSGARRNGYGSGYGGQLMSGDNMFNSALQRGLSAGMGFANSAVESSILGLMGKDSPYGNGKARLNFMWYLDEKGKSRFGGEGDVLWPLYDSLYTTVYTQVGARSMYGGGNDYGPDRWIGNIGVGQRWFPGASVSEDGPNGETIVDSGDWMFGYNAFYDHDLTRGHQRGGLGLEAQYDWLKVAGNLYLPLSSWKSSQDFNGDFVKERAAQGWDLRVKSYLPFYREVAVTGAYTQWYGDNVGMFGPAKLERDPKIWSYGLEYTPVPAMTAFVNQRQTERGRADTEFGLRFTYHFGLDGESQFKPSAVAEMRTVHGSRHDFVDRENKIILEYKAKDSFHIDYLGYNGNVFTFRVRNGFDKAVVGQMVQVMAGGAVTIAQAPVNPVQKQTFFAQALDVLDGFFSVRSAHADAGFSYTSDGNGKIYVRVDDPTKLTSLTASAGNTSQTYTRQQLIGGGGSGSFTQSEYVTSGITSEAKTTITLEVEGVADGTSVAWAVTSLGGDNGATLSNETNVTGGTATAEVANKNWRRTVTITATVEGTPYTTTVRFGAALPSGILAFYDSFGTINQEWSAADTLCKAQGGRLPLINGSTSQSKAQINAAPAVIDGIGTVGASWPSGLYQGNYWAGTEYSDTPGNHWVFGGASNVPVVLGNSGTGYPKQVLCVPN